MRLAICNLRASRVNLLMNDYAAGLPSPLAFLGLADAIIRDLNLKPWSARVLPVLHRVYVSEGRTRPEMEPSPIPGGPSAFSTIETVEDMHGTVEFSLIIDLPGCGDDGAVKRVMVGRRLAGGIIADSTVKVIRILDDGTALSKIRRGYAMIRPERPTHRVISYGSLDDVDAIANLLFPPVRGPGSGWHVAVAVGYHYLEDPDTVPCRIRTRRQDIPHIFVEPCVGIAELVSVRNKRLTDMTAASFTDMMWRWDVREGLALGHLAYQPINH